MNQKTYDIVKISICISILCVASFIAIPIPFSLTSITLQTIAINVIAILLKPKQTLYVIGIYILMGLLGFPVFAGGTAGFAKLASPVGGYYLGFAISIFVMSLLKGKENKLYRYILITILVGLPIQHICAIFIMGLHNGFDFYSAFIIISLPFIFIDTIKCVISSIILKILKKYLTNSNQ